MKTDDGLSFASAIDTSDFDAGLNHIQNRMSETASSIEGESARIQSLFTDIPKIDFSPLANMSSLDDVELGFQQVGRVIEENRAALTELEAKYQELKTAAGEAFMSGDDSQYFALSQEAQATEAVIRARKRAIKEAEKYDEELVNLCKEMNKEAAEAEKERQKQEKSAEALAKKERSAASLRTRIRELTMEAAALRDAAQQEGVEIDKSTGRYREIIEELGRLRDIQGDIQAAGNVFANDENQFAGVISGLTGLSGAFSAAQGAVGLFAGENEHLQEIMLKVQSLMAITMGLQQVQQTLNKDSAFSLVTLNSLKKMWNKLLGTSATAQAQETAATESATAAQSAHATATATDTAATEADTAAQEAKNAATVTGTTATATNTTATQGATAAQNAHTGAMVAGTVATKAMSVAMRVLKLALISTGIGALIVLVGELVSWITDLVTAEDEAKKHTEDLNKAHEEAGKTYAEEKIALEDNIKACQTFKGTKEQEKKKVDELNSKYGEALGYYDSLEQWERVLTERGPAYCKLMQLKAERQGILNKYVESYCELLAVQHKAENGDYDAWYRTKAGDLKKRQEEINKQKRITDQWEADLRRQDAIIEQFQKDNNLDEVHIDPKAKTINGGKSGSGKTFDPKAAAREQRKLLQQFQEEVAKYISDTNKALTQNMIDGMEAGYWKELTTIRKNAADREAAWKQSLLNLAAIMRDNTHAIFMSKKGATEEAWESSNEGKRSLEGWVNELLKNETIRSNYEHGLNDIHEAVNTQFASVREKYMNQLIDEFGSYNDKFDKLTVEWQKKIAFVGAMAPEMMPEALRQMDEAFANLKAEDFQKSINWDVVFGNLEDQSLQALQFSLDKVKSYFDSNKDSMGVEQIKTFQEAITAMEDEIASRNPFTALHKSFNDISTAKDELVAALAELAAAQSALTTAEREYVEALAAKNDILNQIDNGQLAEDCQELTDANRRLAESTRTLESAQQKNAQAEQRTLTARNQVTRSYKTFATNLKSASGVVTDLGGKASKLARVFSDDIADGMDKALGFIDEVIDAAGDVISAIGDVGKSVSKSVAATADAAGTATQATAQATATSISTVEKASVILTVISAALQIATAIANLFNNDDEKQEEIERLQERIDQLQWELDNADAVRLRNNTADALQKLKQLYREASNEVLRLHGITEKSGAWAQWFGRARYSAEIYAKSIEKIADYWGNVSYTADKALGSKKYDESRKQLENLAEQQILLQRQINAESDKKDSDSGKIQDYKNRIAEIAEEMATIINEMLEDIIGYTAEELTDTLADAFFEAAAAGEDAMEAWHKKTNEIVADILKRMIITQYLEPEIGKIFDKYKSQWFGSDGSFKGIQAVINSADGLAHDINQVGENFNSVWEGLQGSLGKWFEEDSERTGSERGIATASQDSVDENNARLTTIQGHTYTLVQGVSELNATGNQILEKLSGIESNTAETAEEVKDMRKDVKALKDSVDDITTQGLKLKP